MINNVSWVNKLTSISSECRGNEVDISKKYISVGYYITEAHVRNGWPARKTISCFDQPRTLSERLENARQFQRNFNFQISILVDSMKNRFHNIYGSWPFRFYVIHHGRLVFKAERDQTDLANYIDEVDQWIAHFYQSCHLLVKHFVFVLRSLIYLSFLN